jgi:hypothetical protein
VHAQLREAECLLLLRAFMERQQPLSFAAYAQLRAA